MGKINILSLWVWGVTNRINQKFLKGFNNVLHKKAQNKEITFFLKKSLLKIFQQICLNSQIASIQTHQIN